MAKQSTLTKTAKPAPKKKPARIAESKAPPRVGITSPTELRLIPLNQLSLSPRNVRKVATSTTDDAELLASIRENGIKQNLVVYPSGKNKFHVDAGGRRQIGRASCRERVLRLV